MIITIVSSDKLTLSMFIDFYKSLYSPDLKVVDLNCLFSPEILTSKMIDSTDVGESGRDVLIRYKTKTQTKNISPIIVDKSDVVIKFDIFSTEPEVIKDSDSGTKTMLNRWKMNIDRFNQQKM